MDWMRNLDGNQINIFVKKKKKKFFLEEQTFIIYRIDTFSFRKKRRCLL